MDEGKLRKAWFAVSTYTGHENLVKDNLEKRKTSTETDFSDKVFRIIVAEQQELERDDNGQVKKDKQGNEKMKTVNLYPGYVFVECIMTNEVWFMIRNTPDVTGFVGSSGGGAKPFPIPMKQMSFVLRRAGIDDESAILGIKAGDPIKVVSGPFEGTKAKIIDIDQENKEATIEIMLFGRSQPTKIALRDIEKI
jgi:transcriptional antiterminator NusG